MSFWNKNKVIVITLCSLLAIELITHVVYKIPMSTPAIILLTIVFSALICGIRSGMVCAAIGGLYFSYYFSTPAHPFHYTAENLENLIVWTFTGLAVAAVVGFMKSREKALKESENKFRDMAEKSLVGIYITQDGICKYVNPKIAEMFGYTVEELIEKLPIRDLVMPEDWPTVEENLRKRLTGELKSIHYEIRGMTKNNESIYVDVYGSNTMYRGRFAVVGTIMDITERKKTEKVLRENEARLRLMIQHVGAVLWTTDTELKLTFSQGALLAGLDLQPEELVGKNLPEYLTDDEKLLPVTASRAALKGEPTAYEIDWRGNWYRSRIAPLRNEEGKIIGTIGVTIDITQLKRTEEVLRTRIVQQAALAKLGQSALISHDLSILMNEAVILLAKSLDVEYAKVLELLPDGSALLLKAGMGWKEGYVGRAMVSADTGSQAGYTLLSHNPVIVEDFNTEKRFMSPPILVDHGVVSGMSVIIGRHERPFGVLGVHTTRRRTFTEDDVHFLQVASNILAEAVERKQAEDSLKESEKRFRSLVEATSQIIWTTTADGRVFEESPTWQAYTGQSFEELHSGSRGWMEAIHPDDREKVLKAWSQATAGQRFNEYEYRLRKYDGSYRHFLTRGVPVLGSDGRISEWIGTCTDITEAKQSEEQIRQRTQELESLASITKIASHSLDLEALFHNTLPEIVKAVKTETAMIFLAEEAEGKLRLGGIFGSGQGFQTEESLIAIGECLCGLALVERRPLFVEDIFADPRCTLNACKNSGLRSIAVIPLGVGKKQIGVLSLGSVSRRDFSLMERFLSTIGDSLSTAMDNALLYQEVKEHAAKLEERVIERTAQIESAKFEIEQANIKLKQIDQLKSLFIASMSHELRTPLNSIIGFSSIMLDEWFGPLNEEQKENLAIVLRSGKHLLALINDVIDVSKIEAGMIDIQKEDFDLDDLITEAVNLFTREIQGKRVELKVESIHQKMQTDRRRLLQCVLNLISNAVKFMEKGRICVQTRKVNERGNLVEISVEDTGTGIREEDMAKLFFPFVRLDSPLKTKPAGTGLGLYLTKKLVQEVLEGEITGLSEYNKGSKFTIVIPATIKYNK